MKTGDMVKHSPENSFTARLYEDWGHQRDFDIGLIVDEKPATSMMPNTIRTSSHSAYRVVSSGRKPAWYHEQELEIINEFEP